MEGVYVELMEYVNTEVLRLTTRGQTTSCRAVSDSNMSELRPETQQAM